MSFLGRLLGVEEGQGPRAAGGTPPLDDDARALERYRYMMKTATPDTIEQAHAEAFAKLSPAQRRQVLSQLAQVAPAKERAAIQNTSSEDPHALARVATRAEIRQPGVMERTLGGSGFGVGGGLLSSFAAGFVGSLVAQSFFSALGSFGDEGVGAEGATAGLDESAGNADPDTQGSFADDVDADGGDGFDGGDFDV